MWRGWIGKQFGVCSYKTLEPMKRGAMEAGVEGGLTFLGWATG